jgi:hypothetical protein
MEYNEVQNDWWKPKSIWNILRKLTTHVH